MGEPAADVLVERLHAVTIEDPEQCAPLPDRALSTPGPVVIEAVIDPFVPPMPPNITVEQATQFAKSLLKGEPREMIRRHTSVEV